MLLQKDEYGAMLVSHRPHQAYTDLHQPDLELGPILVSRAKDVYLVGGEQRFQP